MKRHTPMLRSSARLRAQGIALRALAAALTVAAAAPLVAQQRPTPEQARTLLQTRPDLVAQLRSKLLSSGLTPDQVRARLRAEGYPEDLLDAYLPGGMAPTDSTLSETVLDAVRALGVVDEPELDSLRYWSSTTDGRDPAGRGAGRLAVGGVVCDTIAAPPLTSRARLDASADSGWITDSPRTDTGRGRSAEPRVVCRTSAGVPVAHPDSGFSIFGLEMFATGTTQFEPNLAGPVDPGYRLGPGDRLVLILTGDVEAAHVLDITREGFVVIPQVGQLHVANLTLGQLEDLFYSRLGRVYSGVRRGAGATTHFSVSVARLRTNQVFVVGDVARPGSYRVSSAGTALSALYAAGGPTKNGSLRRVEIRRGARVVDTLDMYDYLLRGDASHDVRLESGDVIFVPVHGSHVRVLGEVVRPATYELRAGESLADLIRAAGGYKPTASRTRVQIERILPPRERGEGGRDRVVIDVAEEGAGVGDGAALSLPIVEGDVVRVFPVASRVRNRVAVLGNVWTPGHQGYAAGMRLSDAIRRAGGAKPDTYLGHILITRLQPDSTRIQLRSSFRDSTGAVTLDVPLEEDDEVRLFSVADFRPRRYVAISGAVRKSGRVPYREGMTLRDLVLLAGGLQESAYLNEAEVARLPENRAAGVTARTVRVPLDSSYLFERGPRGEYLGPPGIPAPGAGAPEVELRPYDNVLVLHQPDWQLERTVVIAGEVKFPGRYSLVRKDERIADLIVRAGGLTDYAYAGGVVLHRDQHRMGRIGVDLPRVLQDPRFRDNLILRSGDSLYIPVYSGVVSVSGAVNAPLTVAYVPGANLDYYVRAAGGPAFRADMRRAYVTQPNGKVESVNRRFILPDGVPKPRPGGVVFVPEREPERKSVFMENLPVVASLLASVATVVVLLRR